jgi:hypothetical protein
MKQPLSPVFAEACKRMASKIHPSVLKYVVERPIRKITFSALMAETQFKGAYHGFFNGRSELHYPEDIVDWTKYGWDGGTICMIYPTDDPALWVAVHEFGHYIDDMYFCKDFHHFKYFSSQCFSQCFSEDKIKKFIRLRAAMQVEFEEVHKAALETVSEEQKKHRNWYHSVPADIWCKRAPTQYALLNYSEWIAEAFERYCLDDFLLQGKCPHTYEFMRYALSGELYRRGEEKEQPQPQPQWMEEDVSYAAVPAVTYGLPQQIRTDHLKTLEVAPWPEDYITDVIVLEKCPPE